MSWHKNIDYILFLRRKMVYINTVRDASLAQDVLKMSFKIQSVRQIITKTVVNRYPNKTMDPTTLANNHTQIWTIYLKIVFGEQNTEKEEDVK